MHDLDDVWRDDQLIEALASGQSVDTTDPAAVPLRALTGLVEAAPIPDYGIRDLQRLGKLDNLENAQSVDHFDNILLLDAGRSHRFAVRSLAVALTAVATLSTSGVAAVVTGDPFQPAKVVWHQIQERAGDRWGADPTYDEDRLDSGSAVGGDTGDSGEADSLGAAAQAAVFEAGQRTGEPSRLQRVALPRQAAEEKDGLEAGQAPSQDRAVAQADATGEPQPAEPSASREDTTTEERQVGQEERTSGTSTGEDSAQQREETQRSEEDQESQDSGRSDQPEEDEQEPTPDAPADDLDPGIVPDGSDEDPGDTYGSMRSTQEDPEDSDEAEESDGATITEPAPDEDTSSTEESTAEESEDDGSWTEWYVEQRAGSTDETVAPPGLNR